MLPVCALAEGTQTGVISGVVFDPSNVPLPDVVVTLSGAQMLRSVHSNQDGRFRFPALEIGTYEVKVQLLDLSSTARGVSVHIDQTTEVALWLGEEVPSTAGAKDETIQVVAVAPLIDRFDTRLGASVSRDFLEQLPVERIYQSVAQLLPDVTDSEDGNPNVTGALRSANLNLVDGVDTSDSTTGLFGLNLAYESIREVDVSTAALPVEYGRATGAVINVVTRSGTPDFEGSLRWLAADPSWGGDYSVAFLDLETERGAAAETDETDVTVSATLSGPLVPDRLWFFAGFESTDASFLRPTLAGPRWDEDTQIESATFKSTWQPAATHSLVVQFTGDDATFAAFAPFDRSPGENRASQTPQRLEDPEFSPLPGDVFAVEKRSQDGDFAKLQWNVVRGQNLSLSFNGASQERQLDRSALNDRGVTAGAPHYSIVPLFLPDREDPIFQELGFFNGIADEGFEERSRRQANASADWYLTAGRSEHELRFGLDYQRTRSTRQFNVAGLETIDPATGMPASGQIFIDLDIRPECVFEQRCASFDPRDGSFQPFLLFDFWSRGVTRTEMETWAVHTSDVVTFGNWLISVGARFESVRAADGASNRLVSDDSFSPRLGIKYDPLGTGAVLLSATYSRYREPILQAYLDDFQAAEPFSGFTEYEWAGFSGVDCSGQDPADVFSPCWRPTTANPLFPLQGAEPNLDLERAAVDELTVSFEKELSSTAALELAWVERRWDGLWDDSLRVDFSGEEPQIASTVRNLSRAERRHRALRLLFQKRYSQGWQLLGSYTWSETEGNLFRANGRSTFDDFSDVTDVNTVNRYGAAPYDARHRLQLYAIYRRSFAWGGLSLGTAVRYRDGFPYQPEQIDELGLRFLEPRGSRRLEDVFQWDVSAALDVPLASDSMELEFKLEVFNLTDESSTLAVETELGTGRFEQPRSLADLQRPRHLRLLVGLQF